MKKPPKVKPTAARRLKLTRAALAAARGRLYAALGNKGLPDDVMCRAELWAAHKKIDALVAEIAWWANWVAVKEQKAADARSAA